MRQYRGIAGEPEKQTMMFRATTMTLALSFFGDRSNWPLSPCCCEYRVKLREIDIDFMRPIDWSDEFLAAVQDETQKKLTEYCNDRQVLQRMFDQTDDGTKRERELVAEFPCPSSTAAA